MSSKYLVAALSAVALAACNNEDVMEANRGRGISFQVATEASTRIGATTTNTIDNFKVWGFTGSNETLMNGVAVSKTGGEWSYGDPIFWPESTVDFYAVSPTENCGGTVSISSSAQQITGFTVNPDQASQVDLLYAVNKAESKDNHESTPVSINFRHALSQIVFKAKNTNANLKVMINGVKVVNVVKGGDFTYPAQTTANGNITTETQGTWKLLSGDGSTDMFTAGITAQTLDGKVETAVDLTTVTESAYTGSLFLMPQELTPWNIDEDKTNENGGSYFVINCKIYNKAGDDEVLLWPSEDNYAYVAIPTSDITWEQGKKYVYTFTFGNGGGYVPPVDPEDPDKEPEDGGDPVLVPVDFTVTVDDFEDGKPQDIDMNNDGK